MYYLAKPNEIAIIELQNKADNHKLTNTPAAAGGIARLSSKNAAVRVWQRRAERSFAGSLARELGEHGRHAIAENSDDRMMLGR